MEPLNLPITGICSFGKYPICTDLDKLDADIAVLGVPCDFGVGFMSGARLAPAESEKHPHSMAAAPVDIMILKTTCRGWQRLLASQTAETLTFYIAILIIHLTMLRRALKRLFKRELCLL